MTSQTNLKIGDKVKIPANRLHKATTATVLGIFPKNVKIRLDDYDVVCRIRRDLIQRAA